MENNILIICYSKLFLINKFKFEIDDIESDPKSHPISSKNI